MQDNAAEMKHYRYISVMECNHMLKLSCLAVLLLGVSAQRDGFCFRLTYLGPGFDNYTHSSNNSICKDITTSPCLPPVFDKAPNFTELWAMEGKDKYVCPLDKSSVCAKWINYFDNQIVNVTYLCTRISIINEGAMKEGCMTHYKQSYSTQVCACRTLSPRAFPCNYATHIAPCSLLQVVQFLVTFVFMSLSCSHT